MFIENLYLNNFKNLSNTNFKFDNFNIIYGDNSSGKTNLIEAIFIILNGHSFSKNNKFLQKDKNQKTFLSSLVRNYDNLKNNIYIEIYKNKKIAKINSKKVNTVQFKKNFYSIIFSIESFISFKNKKYLFSLIDKNSFIKDREILNDLLEYRKIIKIKQSILANSKIDKDALFVINKKLVSIVDKISQKRKISTEIINKNIQNMFKLFSDKTINISYEIKELNQDVFKNEILKRRIQFSLNKDKVNIFLDEKDIFSYSSSGEKKIALFCIVMSIVKYYNTIEKPIILIDDLEGDLDNKAKRVTKEILGNMTNQIFLTTLGYYLDDNINTIYL